MKRYWALVCMNLASLPERLGLVLTIVIGVGCAVGVLVSMLAMAAGARREVMGNVRADHAVVLSLGAQGPMQSSIAKDLVASIGDLPGVRRNDKGKPIAVPQVMVYVRARGRATGKNTGFLLAGVGSGLTEYAPQLRVTSGRMFRPGLREVIASNLCARKYSGFAVGDKRAMRGGDWEVVGNFSVGQAEGNCSVFADADVVLAAFSRNTYNQVNVMLQSADQFDELTRAVEANPTLHVEVKHEAEIAEENAKLINGILNFVSYFVGAIMAVAATLGAINSLYALVDGRRRELATLRAVGFRAGPVIAALLTESILLAIPGALIGAGLAWLLFNGFTASPFGFTFHLAVTARAIATGILWALVMGLVGGVLPAWRGARVPVTAALRVS